MDLGSLKKLPGSTRKNKRVGRGEGSGWGCTAGRGHKGQKSRSGAKNRDWFEGGQMPIQRRLPKFGFRRPGKVVNQVVNLSDLAKVPARGTITPEVLQKHGLIKKADEPVKILGDGDIKKKMSIKVHAISKSAQEKIEKAGGSVTIL